MKFYIILMAFAVLKLASCQIVDVKYKKFINDDIGYEILYPGHWVIKTNNRPKKGDTTIFETISFDNIKEDVIVAGGGPFTENGTSFQIKIWNSTRGGKKPKDIEESIIQGYLSSNQDIHNKLVNKRLKQVKDTIIGGQNLKVWYGKGWADCGLDFIYKDKFYRFHFMSGSKKQFLKDYSVYEKMISSFRLLH